MEQFFQIVLKGSSRQKKLVIDFVRVEDLEELGLIVLQSVSFIHDKNRPVDRRKSCMINTDQFIGSEKDMEFDTGILSNTTSFASSSDCIFFERQLMLSNDSPRVFVSNVCDNIKVRSPCFKLSLPINNG